jgi:acid stress-induced BolA-like protein IbaG/YrbA
MKHMPLFERSTLPIGKRAKLYGEAIYSYYRNSERPGIIAIRTLLEQWFLEIPEGERQDLQQRFRSPIERQHRSAVFELFLHHFLLRCGFQVEFHPDIPGVATHPDFLVSRDGRAHFYLEAIAVSNSVEDEAAINRMNQVYDALNNLESPVFYLGMHIDGAPETPPPAARLRRDLSRWLATLDREAIQQASLEQRYEDIPTHEWTHEGWRIVFEPMPKGDRAGANTSVRPIGLTMPVRARRTTLDEALRDGVAAKDRYGRLTLPFVIAIQVIEEFRIDKIDVMNGLLGPEAIAFNGDGKHHQARVPNGAWISGTGPIHRTISAVMAWSTLEPWNFTRIEPIVVHNPYASNPLPNDVLPVAQNVVDHEHEVLFEQPGVSMESLLGLAKDWVVDD